MQYNRSLLVTVTLGCLFSLSSYASNGGLPASSDNEIKRVDQVLYGFIDDGNNIDDDRGDDDREEYRETFNSQSLYSFNDDGEVLDDDRTDS